VRKIREKDDCDKMKKKKEKNILGKGITTTDIEKFGLKD
jgi:hypothetical protein